MTVAHVVYILAVILWGIWTYKTVKFYKKWFKKYNTPHLIEVSFLPGMWVCFNIIIPLGVLCICLVCELLEIISNNWNTSIF